MRTVGGEQAENSKLAWMGLVTSIGDWLTYFALMKLAYESSGSILVASLSISMKSLAVAFGAWLLPWLVARVGTKFLMNFAQLTSAFLLGLIAVFIYRGASIPVTSIYGASFVLMALKQLFDAGREVHSKSLFSGESSQRSYQAELLRAIFAAQLLGPVLAFLLLSKFTVWVPILLDATSFLMTGLLGVTLSYSYKGDSQVKINSAFRSLKYFKKNHALRLITALRSIVFWLPNSFFNMVLFSVSVSALGVGIESTAILYTVLGLGAAFTSHSLRGGWLIVPQIKASQISDGKLAFIAQVGYAVSTVALAFVNRPVEVVCVVLLAGLCMGINAVTTQNIRRSLSTPSQLPDIISFEVIVGQVTGTIAIVAFGFLVGRANIPIPYVMVGAGFVFACSAAAHLRFKSV